MRKLGEKDGREYEEVGKSPEAPVSGVPSAPPSHKPLPITETTPTGGGGGVAEEGYVYDNIPGDQ